jgi:Carboxypeptidase regulatory-like domain
LLGALPLQARQSSASPQAPAASVAGKVTVTSGNGPASNLAGVPVQLTPATPAAAPQTQVTNSEGHFEFKGLTAGSYTLRVIVEGFKPYTEKFTLGAAETTVKNANLLLKSIEEKVEVIGEAAEIATQSVSATATVSEQQLESLPLRTGKFTEALSVSPSVIQTQEGRLNFNGQAESQGMLLVDSAENVDPVSGSFAIPVPVGAIQDMKVFSTPDSSAYGGFSGGLTKIDLKPPMPAWNFKLFDFIPSLRAKNGSLVGIANMTPRMEFGGPLIKNKLNVLEEITYEFRRDPIHGLSWPFNETYTHSFLSFTEFQYTFSPKHLFTFNVNFFPTTNLYANIDTLIPQVASVDYHRRGASLGISDDYQFDSGAVLNTVVRYTYLFSNAFGQGTADMRITPSGYEGNYFNAWWRNANQVEALPMLALPAYSWHGSHELKFGVDFLRRSYSSTNVSDPIEIRALDLPNGNPGTLEETITFSPPTPIRAADTEISEYAEDQWNLTSSLSLNFGARATTQSTSRQFAFAPRAGIAYSMLGGKFAFRGGAGLIFGHVPLLASDLAGYQTRTLNFAAGPYAGQTITLQNTYFPGTPGSAGPDDPGNSPRTFTWNAEMDSEVRRNLSLRLTYYETHTTDLFIVNPILPPAGTSGNGFLAMQNTGTSNYRQAQISTRYRPGEWAELNFSYAWSQARGDLNSLADTFIPFQSPVLRPNLYGIQPSDVPNRVLAWGFLNIPWKIVFSPLVDIHSGFPYSNLDFMQNYAGVPNTNRFPIYFSMDAKIYRDFTVHMPFGDRTKTTTIRLGVSSNDVTNRHNPHDVFNNNTSPLYGQFAGFQRRFTEFLIVLTK